MANKTETFSLYVQISFGKTVDDPWDWQVTTWATEQEVQKHANVVEVNMLAW